MIRDTRLDSLKGMLILLVIIGHIPYSYFNLERNYIITFLSEWLYFFHMPLFLVLSIFFIKNNYLWIIKRILLILLPYLFWFNFLHSNMLLHNPIKFIEIVFIGNWDSLKSILWFLPALLSLNILFFIFLKYKHLKKILFVLSIGSFLFANEVAKYHTYIPFSIDVALYLFILAYFIKYIYNNQEKIMNIEIYIIIMITLVSSLLLFYFEPIKTHTPWHHIIDLAQFSVATTFIGYISFLSLNISIFILFLKFNVNKIKVLSVIGVYSFPIFLLHTIILYKLPKLFVFNSIGVNIIFLIIVLIITVVAPILISKFLMKVSKKFKYIGMS